MSAGTGPVRLETDGGLATLIFDSPPLNLFDAAMGEALLLAIGELEDAAPRAVLFRAEGKVVTGGVDVHLFAAQADSAAAQPLLESLLQVSRRVAALRCPTVFAAHGLCLTWAFELALACDLIIAAEEARFGLVERRVGLTPTMGGTQRLAARAGVGRAKELVMTGELFSAETLERWNVVNRVLPADRFRDEVDRLVHELANGPTLAHAATKDVVGAFERGGVDLANERVVEIAARLFDTDDLRGAVRSFLSDGPDSATFSGR